LVFKINSTLAKLRGLILYLKDNFHPPVLGVSFLGSCLGKGMFFTEPFDLDGKAGRYAMMVHIIANFQRSSAAHIIIDPV
jgi:hypothetical protein